ncbi:MAG: hypothetical protein FK730_02705 [Asgard group archaeon]|nr:hypothetical protein [Asgard group archaeon]
MSFVNRNDFFRISITLLIVALLIATPVSIFLFTDGIFLMIFIIVYGLAVITISILYIIYRVKSRNRSKLLKDLAFIPVEDSSILDNKDYTCMICKQSLKKDESIISCPNCSCYFHLDHLSSWFNIDTHCPVCYFDYKHLLTNIENMHNDKIEVSLN